MNGMLREVKVTSVWIQLRPRQARPGPHARRPACGSLTMRTVLGKGPSRSRNCFTLEIRLSIPPHSETVDRLSGLPCPVPWRCDSRAGPGRAAGRCRFGPGRAGRPSNSSGVRSVARFSLVQVSPLLGRLSASVLLLLFCSKK